MELDALDRAVAALARATARTHVAAVVLGSGLGDVAAGLPGAITLPWSTLPGLPAPTVPGHHGHLVSAEIDGAGVLVFVGRLHRYEGHPLDVVVAGVRIALRAGAHTVVLTNAAGGVNPALTPGDLVLITDHLNLVGENPLAGPLAAGLGPRFPDLTGLYDPVLRDHAHAAAHEAGVTLKEGVYAWMRGPSYETAAEVRMLATLGADVVGMSTVPEAIAAGQMGARVLGLSLCTNLGAGLAAAPLTHEEVAAEGARARTRVGAWLRAVLPRVVRG